MCSKIKNARLKNIKKTGNPPYKHCLNCGTELNGNYCHICGQEATTPTPSVKDFIMEYLYNAYIWDPKFVQTIKHLICHPGHLTNEFLSGKFASQVHPLKLNMFMLFVFITLFALFSGTEKMNSSVIELTDNETVLSTLQVEMISNDKEYAEKLKTSPRDTVLLIAPLFIADEYPEFISRIRLIEKGKNDYHDKWAAAVPHALIEDKIIIPIYKEYYSFNTEEGRIIEKIAIARKVWEQLVDISTRYFPMIVLLTAPFLAFALRLVHHKHKCPRISHFIFSLHYTAHLELLIISIFLLYLFIEPPTELMQWILLLTSCAYLTISFRQVYKRDSWIKSCIKAILTTFIYLMIILSVFIGLFLIACVTIAFSM
ncbi:MAG: DUF3667 domain-containing protein [Bacteroidaceae bacterium]|nr:DUF3667 domain-containing protein [Bacteroidaceae bacterium]